MEFLISKLNYIACELDKLYNINAGGCCYFAYKVAYWLEKYKIDYQFIIQNDSQIVNETGKHYCLKVLSRNPQNPPLYVNKLEKYPFIKTICNLSSTQILERYKTSKWSTKYDVKNNDTIDKLLDSVFNITF